MLRELEALDKSKKSVKYLLELVDWAIEHAMSGEGLFVTKTVHELLWGYKDNLLSDIKKIQDDANKLFKKNFTFVTDDTFGLGVSSVFTIMCVCMPCVLGVSSVFTIMCVCALCPGGEQCLHHYVCVCMPCVLGEAVSSPLCVCVCMPCGG